MKITIDIDAKEIAELRALALPEERLVDSISADAKKQLVDEIVGKITDAVKAATTYHTMPLTYEPTNIMPADKITVPIELDTTPLGTAQKKADKLKATLLEVQELIRQTNLTGADIEDKIIGNITNAINRSLECSRFAQDFSEDAEE